jgi:tetratricopeptide (TPR) repeat protein
LSPRYGAARTLLFHGILAVVAVVLTALALFLTAAALDSYHAARTPPAGEHAFERRGADYVNANPFMISLSFPAVKRDREFRVFVLGSSEAMGTPYVHQDFSLLSGRLLNMPNEGGLSTWLARYLAVLLPDRRVTVVNAARGGRRLADAAESMQEAAEVGSPDLVVVLDGNNERDPIIETTRDSDLSPDAVFASTLDRLTRNVELQLANIAFFAEAHKVPTYILTVPNNLRDWRPVGPAAADGSPAEIEKLTARDPRAAVKLLRARTPGSERDPQRWWLLARALDRAGDFAAARECYVRAKDLDRAFLRTRTPWNEAIRRVKGDYARTIDLERLMFSYARDGIPGADLFHDYCHMKLAANRIAAFEIAKRVGEDLRISRPLSLKDAGLEPFTARQLRWLYLIKAFHWARIERFSRGKGTLSSNAAEATARYRQDADSIEEQIELFRSSRPGRD